MKKTYVVAGGALALVLIVSGIVIGVAHNSGNTGQKPGTEKKQNQTNEAISSQGKEDETEIIGDDTPLIGETDTDKAETNKTDTDKTENNGSGEQPVVEEQPGSGEQPLELPFVPYL